MKEFKILIFVLIALPFTKGQDNCEIDTVIKVNCKSESWIGLMTCGTGYVCLGNPQGCIKECAYGSKLDSQCQRIGVGLCSVDQYCIKGENCYYGCEPNKITSKMCACGSHACSLGKYCTNDGNCLDQCEPNKITLKMCVCGSNACSLGKYCTNGNCLDQCEIDAITSKKCVCGSNTCSVDQYCIKDGNCLDQCENGVI